MPFLPNFLSFFCSRFAFDLRLVRQKKQQFCAPTTNHNNTWCLLLFSLFFSCLKVECYFALTCCCCCCCWVVEVVIVITFAFLVQVCLLCLLLLLMLKVLCVCARLRACLLLTSVWCCCCCCCIRCLKATEADSFGCVSVCVSECNKRHCWCCCCCWRWCFLAHESEHFGCCCCCCCRQSCTRRRKHTLAAAANAERAGQQTRLDYNSCSRAADYSALARSKGARSFSLCLSVSLSFARSLSTSDASPQMFAGELLVCERSKSSKSRLRACLFLIRLLLRSFVRSLVRSFTRSLQKAHSLVVVWE